MLRFGAGTAQSCEPALYHVRRGALEVVGLGEPAAELGLLLVESGILPSEAMVHYLGANLNPAR